MAAYAAIEVENVTRSFEIRESAAGTSRSLTVAQFVLGSSFEGRVRVTEKRALKGVSFRVQPGEIVGVLGENGSGKTTLLDILSTALLPDSGDARILGHSVVFEPDQVRDLIAPVFASFSLTSRLTARQNLEYVAAFYRFPRAEASKRIKEALRTVSLEDRADDLVERFSTGMVTRLKLASGLMLDRPVYLMDEPLLGIDSIGARDLRRHVRSLAHSGKSVLVATNLVEDIEEMCDRALVLSDGAVIADGMLSELRAKVAFTHVVEADLVANGDDGVEGVRELAASVGAIVLWKLSPCDANGYRHLAFRVGVGNEDAALSKIVSGASRSRCHLAHVAVHRASATDVVRQLLGREQ